MPRISVPASGGGRGTLRYSRWYPTALAIPVVLGAALARGGGYIGKTFSYVPGSTERICQLTGNKDFETGDQTAV